MLAYGPRAAVAALVAAPTLILLGSTTQAATEAGDRDRADHRKHGHKQHGHHGHQGDKRKEGDEVEPGKVKGGSVAKMGWWARTNEPPPETGLLAPPSVPALAAPKGTLPVAQVAGESERITALEFAINGKTDGTVRSLKVALRESEDPSANPNAAAGTVTACPITETFWVGVENGPWATRPTYDCGVGAVQGKRDDAGVWHFDLTSLATDWLAADRQYAPAVMLVGSPAAAEEAAPPAAPPADPGSSSFQVAFDAEKGIGLVAKTKAPPKSTDQDDPGTDDDVEPDPGSGAGSGGGTTGGGLGSVGGGGGLDAAPVDSAPVASGPVDTTAGGAPTAAPPTAVAPVSAGPLPWHSGIGSRFLLLLPALVLAYLLMLAMGPAAQPVAGQRRRGVSRALDRLRPVAPAGGNLGAERTTS